MPRLKRTANPPGAQAELARLAAQIASLDLVDLECEPRPAADVDAKGEPSPGALAQDAELEEQLVPSVPSTLYDLPDDLLGWVFAFVHIEQLCRSCRAVSSDWRALVSVVLDTYSALLTSEEESQQAALGNNERDVWESPLPAGSFAPFEDLTLHGLLWTMSPRASSSPAPFAAVPLRTPMRHRSFRRRLSLSSAAPPPSALLAPTLSSAGPSATLPVALDAPCGAEHGRRTDRATFASSAFAPRGTAPSTRTALRACSGNKAEKEHQTEKAAEKANDKGKRRRGARSPPDALEFLAFVSAQASLSTIDEFSLPLEAATPRLSGFVASL